MLDDRAHVFLHDTPTHASWVSQVELSFSILERRLLRNAEIASVDDLAERIIAFHQRLEPPSPAVPLDLRRRAAGTSAPERRLGVNIRGSSYLRR
ncbi:MAG: hypothetical protein ACRD0W_24265 [Acidimicrobiales bacterium]